MRVNALTVARVVAAGQVISQVAKAARRGTPVANHEVGAAANISVVVPARNEALRIGPLLDALRAAPRVSEVIVVDDESSDATASISAAGGARVIAGRAPPHGWAGKAWALQQGIVAAGREWIVACDADTRPSPNLPAALVERATRDKLDLLTVAGSFDCPTPGARWLHPALLTTLVYRYAPPGYVGKIPQGRALANGQCMTFRRVGFLEAGGFEAVRGKVVEDVALVRHLASLGWSVALLDAADLLTVQMYESFAETALGWSRSLTMPGVEPGWRRAVDVATIALVQGLALPRLLLRRADALDIVMVAVRLGTLAGTARTYRPRGRAYWLSPTADPLAAVLLVGALLRRRTTWHGRTYPPS